MNPEIPIHGIFGGEELDENEARTKLGKYLRDFWVVRVKSSRWKWLNTDLSVRLWYRDIGYKYRFEMAHVLQWDILCLDSIAKVFAHVPKDCVGLTGLIEAPKIEANWYWSTEVPFAEEFHKLRNFVRENELSKNLMLCLGPAYCLPRAFLEKYSSLELPQIVSGRPHTIECDDELGSDAIHDEVRLPLVAQFLRFRIVDTRFYMGWFDAEVEKFFNARWVEIEDPVILNEMKRFNGRRVFHPYRRPFPYIDQFIGEVHSHKSFSVARLISAFWPR